MIFKRDESGGYVILDWDRAKIRGLQRKRFACMAAGSTEGEINHLLLGQRQSARPLEKNVPAR